ncbi:MAG: 2-oxoacid:acceptor oxidoreductase family protein [Desulfovibrio sp.]|jgi:2-oxoglutarate ferredoxin oxidoreductase subunit gamma|nr:2-oxoacid:acceptor oxidoreductase family protein [Desulfovibrio sp.]
MMPRHEILMAGTGGQGLVLMATFLGEAAIEEGLNVAQTQSYGVAQRGGFISAEVVASKGEVYYQSTRKPDVILALHGVVGSRYDNATSPVIFDSTLFEKNLPGWRPVPFTSIAQDLGAVKAANIVALGALLRFLPAISVASLEKVVRKRFKGKLGELNAEAIKRGYEAAGALR